jgi:hypothetical protein
MKSLSLAFVLTAFASVLNGCATYQGVEEFGVYREAFQQVRSASDAILDRLAVAERQLWRFCANYTVLISTDAAGTLDVAKCEKFDAIRTEFRVADSGYLVTAGDPPQAEAFRRAITAIGAYTEALNLLAGGQTAEAVAGQVGQIAGLASAAAATLSPVGTAGSLGSAISGINENVTALQAPITTVFGFPARAEFRDQLLEQSKTMQSVLSGVIDATPAMFKVFAAAEFVTTPAGRLPDASRVEASRLLLAHWVEMLKALRRALDAAVVAAGSEDGAGVGDALATSQMLVTLAQDIRRTLAGEGN